LAIEDADFCEAYVVKPMPVTRRATAAMRRFMRVILS
jgi:hypothetical protein